MSWYSGDGIDVPFSASGDLNDVQFRFVKLAGTTPRVDQASGASNPFPIGVLQNDPRTGEAANVRIHGVTKLEVDAAASSCGYGVFLTCGSTGMGVPEGGSGSTPIVGVVVGDPVTSGSGVYTSVLLLPLAQKVGAS